MQSIVVTGVSTGIGRAIARVLVERGFRVFGSVRKAEDAGQVSRELGEGFVPLIFDVTDETAVRAAADSVAEQLHGDTLLGLVNNAGIAVPGPLAHLPAEDFRRQLEVNLVGVLIVTQAFLPLLGTDRSRGGQPGRIVNISSSSGRVGYPFIGAYAASKHGLEGFSESLRRELMLYGIEVIIVGPGSVATPIWEKAEQVELTAYAGDDYLPAVRRVRATMLRNGKNGLPSERVGEVVLQALTVPRPRLRYAVARRSFLSRFLLGLLPRRLVDDFIARTLGFK